MSAEPNVPRGRSRERTFQQDLTHPTEVERETRRLTGELVEELPEGRRVVRATVKVRFAPFFTSTHAAKLLEPTTDPEAIVEGAMRALGWFDLDRPVRLLGVRAELADPTPAS